MHRISVVLRVFLLGVFCVAAGPARAVLTIEITEGMEGALPIAVVPFGLQGGLTQAPENIGAIIANDLRRSGRFEPLGERDMISQPHDIAQVNYADWRMTGVDSLVIGRLRQKGVDSFEVEFQLIDVPRARRLIGFSFPARRHELRRVAHHISDLIYKQLTGQPGAFNTQIAYVTTVRNGDERKYALQVADSDGYNSQTILSSAEPIMSPSWSPDGTRLAYVSFEDERAAIYVQSLASSRRTRVSRQQGVNGAPAWSPDGHSLALTLSRDGNLEIYVLTLKGGGLRRITRSAAIDTEPVWTPEGRHIIFTSDRGGGPQLYKIPAQGGRAQRLTFEGRYNAAADIAPDGRQVALVHRTESGRYRIGVLDQDNGVFQLITDGSLDESPSIAPNGSMVLYATREGGRGVLAAASMDGRFRQRLVLQEGDVREPAWSPPPRQ